MSAEDFALDWLRLRAPFDAAAADTSSASTLAVAFGADMRRRRERGAVRLLDLGGGCGANILRLAPRIPGSQNWLVVNSNGALLAAISDTIEAWARRIGAHFERRDGGAVRVMTPQRIVTVAGFAYDLRDGLDGLNLAECDGVAGSALLDLVSADWLDPAISALARHRLPALFTLNVDGRFDWFPAMSGDEPVAEAFRRDLATAKGFGPALGAAAAAYAERAMAAQGYAPRTGRSDWHIGTSAPDMHLAMLSFIAPAAARHVPAGLEAAVWRAEVEAWRAAKSAQIGDGTLEMAVGHTDLLAVL